MSKRQLSPIDNAFLRGKAVRVPQWIATVLYFAALWSALLLTGAFDTVPFNWVTLALFLLGLPSVSGLHVTVGLAVLAYLVSTRKRVGWWVLLGIQLVSLLGIAMAILIAVAPHLLASNTVENLYANALFELPSELVVFVILKVLCSTVITAWLLCIRRAFPGRIMPGSIIAALVVLAVGFLTAIATGSILWTLAGRPESEGSSKHWIIGTAMGRYLTRLLTGEPSVGGPLWIRVVISTIMAITIVAALFVFLRGRRMPGRTMADDLKVRDLLARYGSDSLGYFATRADRSIVESADGEAVVSYAVALGVSIVGGDPIGARSSWADAITRWMSLCAHYGWVPAAMSVSEEGAKAFREAGFLVRLMGDEAVIHTRDFSLSKPSSKPLQQAVRRVQRAGVQIHSAPQSDISPELKEKIARAVQQYRVGDERGFTMALDRVVSPEDPSSRLVWATRPDGMIEAVLSFVPFGHHGLSLSHMRRYPGATNGVMEAMVVHLLRECADAGITQVSLNFAMFRKFFVQGEAVDARAFDRALYSIMRLASRFWQLESLYESNARYAPEWVPRYMCLPGIAEGSRVGLAAGMLEGFVPHLGRKRVVEWTPTREYLDAVHEIEATSVADVVPSQPEVQCVRAAKAQWLEERGMDPYPPSLPVPSSVTAVEQARVLKVDTISDVETQAGGRVRYIRDHGGIVFVVLEQERVQIQAVFERSKAKYFDLLLGVQRGDVIRVEGYAMRTRTGELSVSVRKWAMAAKAIRPVPHVGDVIDPSQRGRERVRYLLANPDAVYLLQLRSKAVKRIREFMAEQGYCEVETPMLHPVQGGANARPFVTHINAYDADVFMRIAPELYLKRLAVAGMGAIYEMGRSFRNEGADATHNPEFTSLEAYRAGGDYTTMRTLTEQLIKAMATEMFGKPVAHRPADTPGVGEQTAATFEGHELHEFDLSKPWPVVRVYDAVSQAVGQRIETDTSVETLVELAKQHEVELPPVRDHANLIGALYDDLVEAHTVHPTFYCDFPAETSPLTRKDTHNPALAQRWDLVAFGMEIGTAYTELTDPRDQRERFTMQSLAAAAGDPEAMSIDEAFLSDLELGLVPTGGLGLGVDRLCMMLTGVNIRPLLTFPFVKPK